MIVFLNFAPIEFMGGAEKWMLDMASHVSKGEDTVLVDVSSDIANLYGRTILGRSFDSHIRSHKYSDSQKKLKRVTLSFLHFIPFTQQWNITIKIFRNAELLYIKYEILEILISIYFGGFASVRKTIAGMHSPFNYPEPLNFIEHIHNIFYKSTILKYYLSKVRKIHVLNYRDEVFLKNTFKLKNVVKVPNGVSISETKVKNTDKKRLQIIFVGVLSRRKGIDTLIDIIKHSPVNFDFHIIGGGPMKKDLLYLNEKKNFHFHGYVNYKKLEELYGLSDVVLFPSRSESFGLVLAEGIAYGSQVIIPKHISLGLPAYIEHTIASRNFQEYIAVLKKIWMKKKSNKIDKNKIRKYAIEKFSFDIIYPLFSKDVLEIKK